MMFNTRPTLRFASGAGVEPGLRPGGLLPLRAGVSALYNIKTHIFDTAQLTYGVALDASTSAWSFVKSQYDDSLLASHFAGIKHLDHNAVEVVTFVAEQRAIAPPTRTTGGSVPRFYSSALTAPLPTVLCRSPLGEAVYRLDDGSRTNDRHHELWSILAVAVITIGLLYLREHIVTAVTKTRRAIVKRWEILVGLEALKTIVAQQDKDLDTLCIQMEHAKLCNLGLERKLRKSKKRKFLACKALEKKITKERKQHATALDHMDALVESAQQQIELRDEDLEQLQQGTDDARTRVVELLDEVFSLQCQLTATENNAETTHTALLSQLEASRQQHKRDENLGAWRISQLHAELRTFKEEAADLQGRLHHAKEHNAELVRVALQVVEDNEAKDVKIASLGRDVAARDDELSTIRTSHEELQQAHTHMQHHLAAAREETQKIKLANEVLASKLEDTEHKFDFAHHEYMFLARDLPRRQALHEEEVNSLRSSLDFANHEYMFLARDVSRRQELHDAEIASLRQTLDFVDHEYRFLAATLPKKEALHENKVSELQAKIDSLEEQAKQLNEQNTLLTTGRDVLAEKISKLEEESDLQTSRYNLLNAAFWDVKERSQKDRAALEALRAGKKVDEHYTDMVEAQLAEKSKQIETLTEQYELADGCHKLLQAAFDDVRERAQKDKAALEALRAGKKVDDHYTEMVEGQLAEQSTRLEDLSEQLEFAADRYNLLKCASEDSKERSDAKLREKTKKIQEMDKEIQELHELLEETNEEAMQANREAQEARAYAENSVVQESDTAPSDYARQSEPTLLRYLFDRKLVERYEDMVNQSHRMSSDCGVDGLGFQCPTTPSASSSRRSPLSNVTNMDSHSSELAVKTQPDSLNGPGSDGMPGTPPSQHGWILDGTGDIPPFPDTPILG